MFFSMFMIIFFKVVFYNVILEKKADKQSLFLFIYFEVSVLRI